MKYLRNQNILLLVQLVFSSAVITMGAQNGNYSKNDKISTDTSKYQWEEIFRDDFYKGTNLDDNWIRDERADYNSRKCLYKAKQASIASIDGNSSLLLEAIILDDGTYHSGHVKQKINPFTPTVNSEIHIKSKIKLIARKGKKIKSFEQTNQAWPAFWTVNETNWPTQGEIDIMEGYSHKGSSHFASNIFYGKKTGKNELGRRFEREYHNFDVDSNNGWHTYEMFWKNANGFITLKIIIDGDSENKEQIKITEYSDNSDKNNKLEFENFKNHSVILNLNVGSDSGIFKGEANLLSKTQMYVDYVIVQKREL